MKFRDEFLECLRDSPLLTEEDFQLIDFVISNQRHPSLPTEHSHHGTQASSWHDPSGHTVFFLVTLITGIICAIATLFLGPIIVLSLLVVATVGVLVARWWLKATAGHRLARSVSHLQTYIREFETLLSLVTQTTRLIRETEIISHGFTRYLNEYTTKQSSTVSR